MMRHGIEKNFTVSQDIQLHLRMPSPRFLPNALYLCDIDASLLPISIPVSIMTSRQTSIIGVTEE